MSTRLGTIALLSVAVVACRDATAPDHGATALPSSVEDQIRLPEGFRIGVWADRITRPRSLALGDQGTVFVGSYFFTRGATSPVYALRDSDGDGLQDERWDLANGFGTPNGVDVHGGALYVVDEHRVLRADAIEDNLESPTWVTLHAGLPTRRETDEATDVGHWWRYLRYGPDDKLYVSVGTRWSFLVGEHTARDLDDPSHYSTIMRMNPDGSQVEIFADGVRNSMGMDFHPATGELWFTDKRPELAVRRSAVLRHPRGRAEPGLDGRPALRLPVRPRRAPRPRDRRRGSIRPPAARVRVRRPHGASRTPLLHRHFVSGALPRRALRRRARHRGHHAGDTRSGRR